MHLPQTGSTCKHLALFARSIKERKHNPSPGSHQGNGTFPDAGTGETPAAVLGRPTQEALRSVRHSTRRSQPDEAPFPQPQFIAVTGMDDAI